MGAFIIILMSNKIFDYKRLTELVITDMQEVYNRYTKEMSECTEEGKMRKLSETFIEDLFQTALSRISKETGINIESRVGSTDCFERRIVDAGEVLEDKKIQVDRHNYINGRLVFVTENKSNLDLCYTKRALFDFIDIGNAIHESGKDPRKIKYIIFSGQTAIEDKAKKFSIADFKQKTSRMYSTFLEKLFGKAHGLEAEIFFVINGKRASTKPVYKTNPGLNENEIERFVKYTLSII